MFRFRIPHRHRRALRLLQDVPLAVLLKDEQGAALLEFAISLPLLMVFVVGIYDFSGAFNQKQKIEQAAQQAAQLADQRAAAVRAPQAPPAAPRRRHPGQGQPLCSADSGRN